MTLYNKVGGALKQVSSLPVKINGEIKDISTLYSKKDGALVVVFSSGALIEFMDYPYPIPVAEGWQYSTDGKTWTTVSEDGEINTQPQYPYDFSGTNITYVSALTSIDVSGVKTLDSSQVTAVYIDKKATDGSIVEEIYSYSTFDDLNLSRISLSGNNTYWSTIRFRVFSGDTLVQTSHWISTTGDDSIIDSTQSTFTGYVKAKGELNLSEYYNETGEQVAELAVVEYASDLSVRYRDNSNVFVNGAFGYVLGGYNDNTEENENTVEKYSENGNRTTASNTSEARCSAMTFTNGNYGFYCGGNKSSQTASYNSTNTVDMYDLYGNRTTGTDLRDSRAFGTAVTHGAYGYVTAGMTYNYYSFTSVTDKYDTSGNHTNGQGITNSVQRLTSFSLGDYAYFCGGEDDDMMYATVDRVNLSGVRSSGTPMSVGRSDMTSFVLNDHGYVCGGYVDGISGLSSIVEVYDISGNRTIGASLNGSTYYVASFVLGEYGIVKMAKNLTIYDKFGVTSTGTALDSYNETNLAFTNGTRGFVPSGAFTKKMEMYHHEYETVYSANIPITEGSTYTLNGESGTADVSEVLTFDSPVTGTIKYKKGDMSPAVQLTVVDASGNVVEGADVSITEV